MKIIEINKNIELYQTDFEEVKSSIEQDFSFLEKISKVFPILHLFIGEEFSLSPDMLDKRLKKEGRFNLNESSNLSVENSRLGNEAQSLLIDKEKEFPLFDFSNNSNSMPVLNLSEDDEEKSTITTFDEKNSLIDKEYLFVDGNNLRTIKIYFTNLFRKDCELNKKEKNMKLKLDSNSYCIYLKDQLMNYLVKKSLFITNNEIEEDKDEDLISNKENNVDKKEEKKEKKEEKEEEIKEDNIENIKLENIEKNNIKNDV